MMQAQINEAGHKAYEQARGRPIPRESEGGQEQQAKASDPASPTPEAPMDSPETLEELADFQGPAGSGKSIKTGDHMAVRPPVAGKSGEQDMRGDMVGGINKHVGDFSAAVGDTEAGRKGTGGSPPM